jgi:hypothetical protein
MPPTVSVVIPCYNHGHYLANAVQSVSSQTLADWELLIIDDGSTDNTPEVAARFSDPRIRYIYQENQGLSAARNTGICAAQGEYLAFLDADDEWEPGFLHCCARVLAANRELAGVYTRYSFIDPEGKVLPQTGGQVVPPRMFRSRLLNGGFLAVHGALVRASVVRQVGMFDVQIAGTGDWDLWIRIAQNYQMQGIVEPLARYRIYPGSMSTDPCRMHEDRMRVLAKHFGPAEGDPVAWPDTKRRVYGAAYQSAALDHIRLAQPGNGWRFLTRAIQTWPPLLENTSLFFELICGDQPKGYRGVAHSLDIGGNGREMLKYLDSLFVEMPSLKPVRRTAYGNAYLSLAMLSDQAGDWTRARLYLRRAIAANPSFLASYPIVRRLLKLYAGKRLVDQLKRLRTSESRGSL